MYTENPNLSLNKWIRKVKIKYWFYAAKNYANQYRIYLWWGPKQPQIFAALVLKIYTCTPTAIIK